MNPKRAGRKLVYQDGFYKSLLDNMQIGIIVSDADGYLIYINQTYARFLNIRIEESVGKHATEVIANSRLHVVAKTGLPEINYPHKFKDTGYLVHRVPIRRDGRIVAVLGMVLFDSAPTAYRLAEKLVCLEHKLQHYQQQLASLHTTRYTFDHIIGNSDTMQIVKTEAVKAATNDLPVLITGESGTGKELFAQAVHHAGARKSYPFVSVNCASIPKDLLEAELFGYEKGSFTGADPKGKPGKFEIANMGTIFLDEIGDMPLEMQPKLLRVLEVKEFERVGGTLPISSDFRIIAATNQDIERIMKSGHFRRDLYYRLNVIPLEIAPLRKRPDDILPMAYHFIEEISKGPYGKGIRIGAQAETALKQYEWPGNGRELRHVIERIMYGLDGNLIRFSHLPDYIRPSMPVPRTKEGANLTEYLESAERYAIKDALAKTANNKSRAADLLGIHRTLLYRKMKKLGIEI